jgi:hypothetical protein
MLMGRRLRGGSCRQRMATQFEPESGKVTAALCCGWRAGERLKKAEMSTGQKKAHEVGLLRRIVQNLVKRPSPYQQLTHDILRAEGLARARRTPDALVGVLRPGADAFSQLSEILFSKSTALGRGTSFATYEEEFFSDLLDRYLGRDPNSIVEADVLATEGRLLDWFAKRAANRTIFVPCVISPWPSPRFSIGPISFVFLEDVKSSEYYPHSGSLSQLTKGDFDELLAVMRTERAHWLAVVDIEGCDRERALEMGDLAVDLAIVALQVGAPYIGTKNMSRLAARRGTGMKLTLSVSDGRYASGRANIEPGLSIGQGYLGKIVGDTGPLITAVGNCVRSFATGIFRLPKLGQAWCDSAYWLHQGLGEPLDSIAVAKLETSIEVLLGAGSASGSEKRILTALDTFYALKANDPITPNTQATAKQFAHGFVRDRSRILHGTWSTLNSSLSASREALENLAVTIIRASVVDLDAYVQSPSPKDDIEAFLTWIKASRSKLAAKTQP